MTLLQELCHSPWRSSHARFFQQSPHACLNAQHVKCVYKARRAECGETRSLEAQRGASLSTGPTHAEQGTAYYTFNSRCPNKQHIWPAWQIRFLLNMLSYLGCHDNGINHFSDTIWGAPHFFPSLLCVHVRTLICEHTHAHNKSESQRIPRES